MSKQVSVVVPLLNESESLPELAKWIDKVMHTHNFTYELIMIDDGSTDNSWEIITQLATQYPHTHGIGFSKNFGKSQALHAGFKIAQGDFVVTMDADLQDSPEEIMPMIAQLKEQKLDLISGWKKKTL